MPNIIIDKVYNDRDIIRFPLADGTGKAKFIDATNKSGAIIQQYHEEEDYKVGIKAIQTGNGDPSPSNIRPISGWTGANIYVSPTLDQADATVYNIDWTDAAGTVYGGTLDVTLGKLRVTHKGETFADLKTKTTYPSGAYFNILKSAIGAKETTSAVWGCSCFKKTTGSANYSVWETTSAIRFKDTDFASVNDFVAALGSEVLVYELAEPLEYDLTPTEIQLLMGQNNIWADCGDITVTWGTP